MAEPLTIQVDRAPARAVVVGSPARQIRDVPEEELLDPP